MLTIYNYIENIIATALLDMNETTPDPTKTDVFAVKKLSPLFSVKR